MKCEDAEKLMIRYLDNELEEELREDMDRHLSSCERCLDEIRKTKELFRLLSEEGDIKPDESLRINFYHMLHSEIHRNSPVKEINTGRIHKNQTTRLWFNIAAGIAILVTGTLIGRYIRPGISSGGKDEISQLRSEVSDLKKVTMLTMLRQESSSDRIEAVRYSEDIDAGDQNVIEAMVNTLNTDRNVNVRMAAAYALAKYSDQRQVCDSLVKSLTLQTDPLIQVTLINILAEKRVKNAFVPIQSIIENKKTLKEVRSVAENSLRMLI
jgi:hypothetical protein